MFVKVKTIVVLFLSSLIASCATTDLLDSWKEADLDHSYQHLMIIGISDSQQNRQIYEKYFVGELKKSNITATPSYQLINSKQKVAVNTCCPILVMVKQPDIIIFRPCQRSGKK